MGGWGGGVVSLVPLVSGNPNPTDRFLLIPFENFLPNFRKKKTTYEVKKPTGYKMALDFSVSLFLQGQSSEIKVHED